MKRIIMFVLLFAALKVAGQTTGYLRFDTVKIMKQNGTCELYIINKTKDSLGVLTNVGGGLTQFIKSKMLNDSTIVIGLDTITIRGAGGTPARFGLEDASTSANRSFNFNNFTFEADSFSNYNLFSKAQSAGVDRGVIGQFRSSPTSSYLWHYHSNGVSTRSYGFNAYPQLTQMFAAGHMPGHATYVQSDTLQVILEADPNRLYMFHDSVALHNINGGNIDFRIRTLPQTIDTTNFKPLAIGPLGQLKKVPGWPGSGGGGTGDLQTVTTAGNTTTNDIIHGSRTNSVGRFSVEKTYNTLNQHDFDSYSILNPSTGGSGFASFDASTTMAGSVDNDHYIAYQSRQTYTSSGNLTGDYGMTGLYVYNTATGAGTITNAHGVYIRNVGTGGTPITNAYGIRILPVTVGTNNFGIRSEGGKNSFVDEVMIGGHTTPIAKLDVRNSSYDQTLYCDNTKANGYGAIFNSSNASGSNVGLDVTASGGSNNKGINFGTAMTANDWNIYSSGNSKTYIAGKVGIGSGITSPTALLHLAAGTATANTAPLKLTSGTNLTTPEDGAIEYNGTHFYGTVGSTRYQLDQQGSATTIYTGDGTLGANRTVSTGGFTTTWSGSNDNETTFTVSNTGTTSASAIIGTATGTTSVGVTGTSSQYIGVYGSSTSNTGIQGESSSGVGVIGVSSTGAGLRAQINPSSNNAIENAVTILRTSSSGAGANGLGAAIQYELETATNGTSQVAGRAGFEWSDATNATRTSQFVIYGVNSATTARKAALAGNGQWTWDTYGTGTHTGTPTQSLQVTSAGAVIEGPLIAAGTYTPTLTGVTNVTGTTAYACQYMRVGNTVTVSGKINIDFTSTGLTEVGISLPIASNIANNEECAGTISTGENTISGAILGDATNNRAHVALQTASSAGYNFYFTFTYQVL